MMMRPRAASSFPASLATAAAILAALAASSSSCLPTTCDAFSPVAVPTDAGRRRWTASAVTFDAGDDSTMAAIDTPMLRRRRPREIFVRKAHLVGGGRISRSVRHIACVRMSSSSSSSSPSPSPPLSSSLSPSSLPPPSRASSPAVSSAASARQRKKKLKTFQRYLEIECWRRSDLRDLQPVLVAVGEACRQINRIVQRAQTDDLYGAATATSSMDGGSDGDPSIVNVQGEVQQKLDVVCNAIMLKQFCGCSSAIAAVASEEEDCPRMCGDVMNDSAFSVGNYVAVFDPLDGSKNIDSSLPVGTIFGIYKLESFMDRVTADTFLQRGSDSLVAAGYCLYSATTVLVLTLGSGVDGFTLDPDKSTFLHTHEDIRIPPHGPIYSFNEANFHDFAYPVRRYLDALKGGSSSVGVRSNARYVGALVADVHNVLINGGIYGYPSTRTHPNGKLRLLYESNPMAMILEEAGGAASTGSGRILDVKPKETHERVPTFLGSVENVFELDQFHKYYDDDNDGISGDSSSGGL